MTYAAGRYGIMMNSRRHLGGGSAIDLVRMSKCFRTRGGPSLRLVIEECPIHVQTIDSDLICAPGLRPLAQKLGAPKSHS